ncbi:MAG: UDP-N-acetylglucosamine--undecaprenyl-phosphate N-acetylglucosaminephosphotransferase [Rhodothalassiaceae bacterium]
MIGETMLGAGFIALAISLVFCLAAAPLANVLGLMDHPDGANGRKRHKRPTPLFGGIAVMVPTLLAIPYYSPALQGAGFAILAASAGTLLIGAIDDRRHINPHLRLVLSAGLLLAAILSSPDLRLLSLGFTFLEGPAYLGSFIGTSLTLICLLGLQNAVNMADGKNGLVLGLSIIWCVFLMVVAPAEWMAVLAVMLVALVVVFGFNIAGRLFLGDAGSYSLSVMLGLLSVYIHNKSPVSLPADTVLLWFLIPVADCIRLIFKRARDGRPVFAGDRNHLHHLIYDAMPWRYGLPLYLGLVGIPGAMALFVPATAPLMIAIQLGLYAMLLLGYTRRPLGVGGMS